MGTLRFLHGRQLGAVTGGGGTRRWQAAALGVAVAAASLSALSAQPALAAGSITVTPSTGLTAGQSVAVAGTGFTPKSPGNVVECNSDANQPTVFVGGLVNTKINVSCTAPSFSLSLIHI